MFSMLHASWNRAQVLPMLHSEGRSYCGHHASAPRHSLLRFHILLWPCAVSARHSKIRNVLVSIEESQSLAPWPRQNYIEQLNLYSFIHLCSINPVKID